MAFFDKDVLFKFICAIQKSIFVVCTKRQLRKERRAVSREVTTVRRLPVKRTGLLLSILFSSISN
jgi:hypothetical protein